MGNPIGLITDRRGFDKLSRLTVRRHSSQRDSTPLASPPDVIGLCANGAFGETPRFRAKGKDDAADPERMIIVTPSRIHDKEHF